MRRTTGKLCRQALIAALPLAVAVTFAGAGTASADVAGIAPQQAPVIQMVAASQELVPVQQETAPVVELWAAAVAEQPITPAATPVAADLEDIATNPNAANPNPMANGAAAGAVVGAVIGATICALTIVGIPLIPLCALGPALQGALIGMLVGAVAPDVVPQVLP
ncbi:hypothetical protein ACFWU5_14815 [Nocardia sp. NPDC058640]|uniref:hypothetical protein n=1 Tax=Nocardia sp. NPDC058640 TaxID=3346571 RepID=UPI003667C66B